MAQNDMLRRYLDAGVHFTQMTQKRAEAIVKDLVKAGEVQAKDARSTVEDLLDRSRKNSERLAEDVRKEVRKQVNNLGLATKADIERLEKKISSLSKAPAKKSSAKKKSTAKKSTSKKA